jgi:hypothetical protein
VALSVQHVPCCSWCTLGCCTQHAGQRMLSRPHARRRLRAHPCLHTTHPAHTPRHAALQPHPQLRFNKVAELIHNSTFHRNLERACVTVFFQEIIDKVCVCVFVCVCVCVRVRVGMGAGGTATLHRRSAGGWLVGWRGSWQSTARCSRAARSRHSKGSA